MAIDLDARCRPTRIITRPSAAANGRAPPGSCRHIGMPPDDDVFCISTLARTTAAADASTATTCERIDRCIALNNNILCIFAPDSADGCAAIIALGLGGQAAGAVFFCRSYFFSLVIRLIRNGQPTISIILVQTCGTGDVRAVQNILAVQLQLGIAASFYGHTRYCVYRFFFFFRPHRYC